MLAAVYLAIEPGKIFAQFPSGVNTLDVVGRSLFVEGRKCGKPRDKIQDNDTI